MAKEQPTHWTLGYSLDIELGFSDGKYLPRKAALLLYPEYFDEDGNPIIDKLPLAGSDRLTNKEKAKRKGIRKAKTADILAKINDWFSK